MKLGKILDPNLHAVLNKLAAEALPLNAAINLKIIIQTLSKEYAAYEEERQNIIQRYSLKNEDGSIKIDNDGNAVLDEDYKVSFAEEISMLLNKEIKVALISLEDIKEKSINSYTANEVFLIEEILKI